LMKEYKMDRIRNVAFISHGGAGKTSLTEAMLYNSGAISRLGKVDDGTVTTDFEPEELKRKISINASLAPYEWKEHKINVLDTPGYTDFVAEVKGSLRAADSALLVLCAASGVEVETEKVWDYATQKGLPRLAFINKMDRENADFSAALDMMKQKLGMGIVPVQIPIGSQVTFQGIVDLIGRKAYVGSGNQVKIIDIPAELTNTVEEYRQQLMEVAAEHDDELLTKYLDGAELSEEEIQRGLTLGVMAGKVTPVFCGSAVKNMGITHVMDALTRYSPAPDKAAPMKGKHPITGQDVVRTGAGNEPFSALVFKTTADPFVGKVSFLRVFSGTLKPDTMVYNATKDKMERIGQLFTLRGKQQDGLSIATAGDIAAVAKLQDVATGDTLTDKDKPILFDPIEFPQPMYAAAVEVKAKGDEDKLGHGLHRLMEEDPTFKLQKNTETGQLLVYGIGDVHLDVIMERLKRKFGVDVKLVEPKVPYRETIRNTVKVEGKHKKQSGGHGQYGHVWLRMEPLPAGSQFEFAEEIFGGAVPRQYVPAVEKGAREGMQNGVLAGYPIVDLKVVLYDGSYHAVDSSEMAFKIATHMALKKGVLQAKPILLEPMYSVEVVVPESYMGDIIGDFNSKRGRILGMEPIGNGKGVVRAQAPLAELFRYAIDLKSLTQGRGAFTMEFMQYEEVPQRIAEGVIAAYQKIREEAH
jgi:elongation factor G